MKRVVVGLSGGVDSAVSAALLVEKGYEVTGVFLECWRAPGCRVDEDRKDAMDVARMLGIEFKVLDFKKEYKEKVVDYFYSEYEAGRTPNPDVMCNREIKFGMFYRWAIEDQGFDYVATGHYARVRGMREVTSNKKQDTNTTRTSTPTNSPLLRGRERGGWQLLRGVDEKKDQSYFLYQLRQEQLKHILFPIGKMTKEEVRKKAKELKLLVAGKPDSQGICFIGPVDVKEFLVSLGMEEKSGPVLLKIKNPACNALSKAMAGRQKSKIKSTSQKSKYESDSYIEIGNHVGACFYTVGQRVGINLSAKKETWLSLGFDPTHLPPLFVVEKDVDNNVLVVGAREETMRDAFVVEEVHWIGNNSKLKTNNSKLRMRLRHGGALISAKYKIQNTKYKIQLEKPAFGVAPGQSAVFYSGDVVLGGGVIGD